MVAVVTDTLGAQQRLLVALRLKRTMESPHVTYCLQVLEPRHNACATSQV